MVVKMVMVVPYCVQPTPGKISVQLAGEMHLLRCTALDCHL